MTVADPPPDSRDRRATWLVALLVALAVVVAAIWWGTHRSTESHPKALSLFQPISGPITATTRIARPLLLSTGTFPSQEVVLISAATRVRQNDAGASIRVVLCAGKPEQGAYADTAERHCDQVLPISGAVLGSDPGSGRQLMVEVIPQRAGQVSIDGLDVTYKRGNQQGSQPTGQVINVSAR